MNKIVFILCLVVTIGCSKSKTDPALTNSNKANIIGSWTPVADTLKTYLNGSLVSIETIVNCNTRYDFFSSGQCNFACENYTTYNINNNVLTVNYPAFNGAPAFSHNETIRQLTAHNLVLYLDLKTTYQGRPEEQTDVTYLTR